jgi:N-glycosylase/DNA lyase
MKDLTTQYRKRKRQIKQRLKAFKALGNAKDEDIFSELCFCILTPQSRAIYCDEAVKRLKGSEAIFKGRINTIKATLRGLVRFHNNKAAYIIAARKLFQNGSRHLYIKTRLDAGDIFKTREWLVENIKGLGYKEASHFLRNIGMGKDIAILDRHILKNLKRYKVIDNVPASLTRKRYIDAEDRMRKFAEKVKIPLEELDLLFWSDKTGFIFK